MNIVIFDTETTSLEKPFCYNVGYQIANTETHEILLKREFVVEQIWSNTELFCSAYYANKRPLYVNRMRARKIFLEKWGYVTQQMIRDFKSFEVSCGYAYNSSFDEKVFNFNCDWFKTINPFESLEIFDIRGNVHQFIAFTADFQQWCDKNNKYTESGNYSTTAETLFQYIGEDASFEEEHTALSDSEIETKILFHTFDLGAKVGKQYKTYNSIPRAVEKNLIIVQDGNETEFKYFKKTTRANKIYLK